eukprot:TRINITY_DN33081_c0_g1_i1.p1 TRINITY_DN33081_c0_g1~~TRINITY_DN33081_c0_g1_i1.p1  ORF type:complete len:299 (-),score=45.78 TRINITY_DN33081_c0_g1_i1:235-1131(-)
MQRHASSVQSAITCVCDYLGDEDVEIQKFASGLLLRTASDHPHAIFPALACFLKRCGTAAFSIVLQLLAELAGSADDASLKHMAELLQDESEDVRQRAVGALGVLSATHRRQVIAEVSAQLQDEAARTAHAGTRRAAIDALRKIAEQGDEVAVAAVSSCLADPAAAVRWAAMEALGELVGEDDDRAQAALTVCLAKRPVAPNVVSLPPLRDTSRRRAKPTNAADAPQRGTKSGRLNSLPPLPQRSAASTPASTMGRKEFSQQQETAAGKPKRLHRTASETVLQGRAGSRSRARPNSAF